MKRESKYKNVDTNTNTYNKRRNFEIDGIMRYKLSRLFVSFLSL